MTSPLPSVQYLVAFQNNALDDPSLITSVASAGTLGGNNVWSDITQWVSGHNFQRGFQHEFGRAEAGTLAVDLNNNAGTFSPWNTSSPFFGFLLPLKLVQIRVTWNGVTYERFTGHATSWPIIWSDETAAWAQLAADDAFRFLNLVNMINTGAYAATVLADSPVGYWRLNDVQATPTAVSTTFSATTSYAFADSSGNNLTIGRNGAIVGTGSSMSFQEEGVLPTEASSSTLFTADGTITTGEYGAWLGNSVHGGVGTVSSQITVETWIKVTSPVEIIGAYAIFVNSGGIFVGADGTLSGDQYYNPYPNFVDTGVTVNDGNWHHVVYVDNSTDLLMYLDGVLVGTTACIVTPVAYAVNETIIGPYLPSVINAAPVTMQLQEVAVYYSILSPTRVAAHYAAGYGGLIQQMSGARVNAVLNLVGWSAGARSVDTGQSLIQVNTSDSTSTKSLEHLQLVETTEVGALFMTGAGKVRWSARNSLLTVTTSNTAQATFGDTIGTEIPFEADPTMGLDDADIWNVGMMQCVDGVLQTAQDSASITSYGPRTQNLTGLLNVTDSDSLEHAQFVVGRFKQPVFRMQTINVNLLDFLGSTSQVASVLALELLYRVVVNRHGMPGGGTTFSQIGLVERIEETVTPESWVVTLALSPTDAGTYFILNDTANGVLNTSPLGW